MTGKFTVLVDDNFHYKDESERYELGEFDDLATAVTACQRIVDDYLHSAIEPDVTADALYQSYTMFGENPFIVGADSPVPFSAWDYAKARCLEIRNSQPRGAS